MSDEFDEIFVFLCRKYQFDFAAVSKRLTQSVKLLPTRMPVDVQMFTPHVCRLHWATREQKMRPLEAKVAQPPKAPEKLFEKRSKDQAPAAAASKPSSVEIKAAKGQQQQQQQQQQQTPAAAAAGSTEDRQHDDAVQADLKLLKSIPAADVYGELASGKQQRRFRQVEPEPAAGLGDFGVDVRAFAWDAKLPGVKGAAEDDKEFAELARQFNVPARSGVVGAKADLAALGRGKDIDMAAVYAQLYPEEARGSSAEAAVDDDEPVAAAAASASAAGAGVASTGRGPIDASSPWAFLNSSTRGQQTTSSAGSSVSSPTAAGRSDSKRSPAAASASSASRSPAAAAAAVPASAEAAFAKGDSDSDDDTPTVDIRAQAAAQRARQRAERASPKKS